MAGRTLITNHEDLNFAVAGGANSVVALSETDLYSSLAIQDSVKSHHFEPFYPTTGSLLDSSPDITFNVGPSMHLTCLADSFLEIDISLVKGPTKAKVVAADKAVPANFASIAWVKDLNVFISGKPVTSSFGNFLHEAYLKVITETSSDSIRKWIIAGLTAQVLQTQLDPALKEGDSELKARFGKFDVGQVQKLYCPILSPSCSQMRFYPSLVDFKFVFVKNDKNLRFTCPLDKTDDFDLKIHSCRLHIKRIELYPEKLSELENKLSSSIPALYYIKNQYVRTFAIEKGLTEKRISNILLTEYLPSWCVVGLLEQKDLKGHRNASNFNFQCFHLNSMYLKSGAETWPSPEPFKPKIGVNSADSQFAREFFSLFGNSPGLSLKTDSGSWLELDNFLTGFALFKFHFNRLGDSYLSAESYRDMRKPASQLDLYLTFDNPLPENVSVVVFSSYLEQFSICKTERALRDVELQYSL